MSYFYRVAPTVIVRANEDFLTYHSDQKLEVGSIVRIPVGKMLRNGVVIGIEPVSPSFKTRAIESRLVATPLPRPLIDLAIWISGYYATHLAVVLQSLLPSGINKVRRKKELEPANHRRKRTKFVLNKDQSSALARILSGKGTFLLHGVTGSGKTQIYIEAAKKMEKLGKSSIVLVPEISLTPQLVAEFANHFENLVFTHSGLGESERHRIWLKLLESDRPYVVIGPRSALFMPLENVGLIVVDECHDQSYKQDQSPKYSALRAVSMLSKLHGANVILGSATPNTADYILAKSNANPVLELPSPAKKTKPVDVEVVDLKNRAQFTKHRFISDRLLQSLESALNAKRQVLIFHNRRGTAPTTLCENCGWVADCSNCQLPLTLHSDKHRLRCHLCGLNQPVMPSCPVCKEPTIAFKGVGTKLIESEIRKLFPKAQVARFDADTPTNQSANARYQEMYDGEIDIIIGTQMLAKGFDLPKLAVVGVAQADSGLMIPDYQSDERVFQLIYQVIGRVGRQDHAGTVVVQTYNPDHLSIDAAVTRNYSKFYKVEAQKRRAANFPPFTYLLKLTCVYKTERGAVEACAKMASTIKRSYPGVEIMGPSPAFHERLGGKFRWQLVIKSKNRSQLVEIAKNTSAPWQFDLDALNIL